MTVAAASLAMSKKEIEISMCVIVSYVLAKQRRAKCFCLFVFFGDNVCMYSIRYGDNSKNDFWTHFTEWIMRHSDNKHHFTFPYFWFFY